MIAIANYGLGNVYAIANIYKRLNIPAVLATGPDDLLKAERIILPGVGAFDWAMARLNDSGLRGPLDTCAAQGKPILGICVGMQMMARRSDEGKLDGLGWIDGEVKKFDATRSAQPMRLPHMGWNDVRPTQGPGLFTDLQTDAKFYFLHSYYFLPRSADNILSTTDYHGDFASSVRARNVHGVQFHPEKSHRCGVQLLKNFAEIATCSDPA